MTEKENVQMVFDGKIPKWLPRFEKCFSVYFPSVINERPAVWEGDDWFGIHWLPDKYTGGLTVPETGQIIIKDIENWKKELIIPNLDAIDWEAEKNAFNSQYNSGTMSLIIMEIGIFERFQLLLGFENALCAFYEYPEETEEILEALTQFKINLVNKIMTYIRPDVIMYMDDLGTQKGPLMSPALWEEFVKEKDTRIFNAIQARKAKVIYHVCGKIDSFFDKIVEMGPQGYHSVQPSNDTKMLKEKYGDKIILVGGIDNQGVTNQPNATEEQIRQEVRRAINSFAPGGGYICGDTDGVCVVEDALKIIVDEYEKYGRSFYQS